MASVKNLKSKHGAWVVDNPDYTLRKQQFADSAPAKIVKPLRFLRRVAAEALGEWQRSGVFGDKLPFPQRQVDNYYGGGHANGGPRVHILAAQA